MKTDSSKFWRYFANVWTVIMFALIISDFMQDNTMGNGALGPVAAIYVAVLAIYSTEKEFLRWHDEWTGRHPGEVYVFLWTILMAGILAFDMVLYKSYVVPSEVVSAFIAVLGILAVTRQSKRLYEEKCGFPERKK